MQSLVMIYRYFLFNLPRIPSRMERLHDKATGVSTNLVCLKEKGKELDRGERKVPVNSAAKKPSFSFTRCSSYSLVNLGTLF